MKYQLNLRPAIAVTVHSPGEQWAGELVGDVSFDGRGEEGEGVAALLAAGFDRLAARHYRLTVSFDRRQHGLDEAAARGAAASGNDSFLQITA